MAPKKNHGPRGNNPTKKPAPKPGPSNPDDNFVVFTNSKDDPKQGGKSKPTTGANTEADAPRKPDTRTLIAGASWTGKLPMTLLSEHCQRQKWDKPEYTMRKFGEDYSSAVILKYTNPKTKATTVLPPFLLPQGHKNLGLRPSSAEARHFAATYTLFRVSSAKNIHMMLPPQYRDLWKSEFANMKKVDVTEGREWMYAADPFAAKAERDEAQASNEIAKAKKREEQTKFREMERNMVDLKPHTSENPKLDRGWARVPKVDMDRRIRLKVESLVKDRGTWNVYRLRIENEEQAVIIQDLVAAGFRKSHVEEAVAECKDREEVLEWLLIHVPEDDLPRWALPEGYSAGISLVRNDLVRESKLKRLSQGGYSLDDCERALDEAGGNELAAAETLQGELLQRGKLKELPPQKYDPHNSEVDQWAEEQPMLEAIYGDRYKAISSITCQIKSDTGHGKDPIMFNFSRPSQGYPDVIPVLAVSCEGLSSFTRLSIARQALQFAEANLLRDPMIYSLVDWLEAHIILIIESPGKLRHISLSPVDHLESHTKSLPSRPAGQVKRTDPQQQASISAALKRGFIKRQNAPTYQYMQVARMSLPAWSVKDLLVSTVRDHAVTIVSGETGSGKSTQSIQFVLDDMISREVGATANILCTQPRRISALGLADRVSEERCGSVGQEVGYSIRGESKITSGTTRITFMTTGVLLRRLQSARDGTSHALADVSHVFIDEVHERSLDTDFLLALLRDQLSIRKDLKIILMSATLDSEVFTEYFATSGNVGRINIEGRTFPIQDYYLDDVLKETKFGDDISEYTNDAVDESRDGIGRAIRNVGMGINYNLIASTVNHIHEKLGPEQGSILIFLPGTLEIERCIKALRPNSSLYPLPLHASLQPSDQRLIFKPAPRNLRKVVASTNVAETSITIADVVAVLDTGRVKETSFDAKDNMVKLEEVWASKVACRQRRGRAGRVRSGECYKLFTRAAESTMTERPEPEIRRVPLEQLCLSVKAMGVDDVGSFLSRTLDPPKSLAVSGGLKLLHRMGALDDGYLTALGRHLSMIPADLRCAKLLVYGAIFGCLESCLTIAAILTVKSPFVSPLNKREEAKAARMRFEGGNGDLLTDLEAYNQWCDRRGSYRQLQEWCSDNFLSQKTLQNISDNREQYFSSLREIGFLPTSYRTDDPTRNDHGKSTSLLRALIAGAFSPQIVEISFPEKKYTAAISGAVEQDPEARTIKYFSEKNGRVFVHPSSVVFDAQGFTGNAEFLSYFTKMSTQKVYIRDLTPFNAYSLLLFSGPVTLDTRGRGLVIDGWLRLRGWARIGVLASRLRAMLDALLSAKIDNPSADISQDEVVSVVRKLVELNGLDQ